MANVVLGVTGGIAAYKACDIVSGLKATGHEVRVIMTENSKHFITEKSLAVISDYPVLTPVQEFDSDENKVLHVQYGEWADIFLVAPATANFIAKLVHGFADDVLTTTALVVADNCMKVYAPAMNTLMWCNPIVQDNVKKLANYNWRVIRPIIGRLACGTVGEGKMEKPRKIVEFINDYYENCWTIRKKR